jgi:hypothetical protein
MTASTNVIAQLLFETYTFLGRTTQTGRRSILCISNSRNAFGVADGLVIMERPVPDLLIVDYASNRQGPWRRRALMAGLAAARKLGHVGGRKRRMTESKIKSAKWLLAGGTPL